MKPLNRLCAALVLLAAGCSSSSPSDGCAKDTDCASGRICGGDGRCVDRSSSPSASSSNASDATADAGTAPASAGAEAGSLVDVCDTLLSCTIDNNILNTIESGTGSLRKVDGHCYWTRTDDGDTYKDELLAGGMLFGGVWTADDKHLVVHIGGDNIIYDCHP